MLKKVNSRGKNISAYLFLIIPLIVYVAFFVIPNLGSLFYSFFKWNGLDPVKNFVGITNYIRLFKSSVFLLTLKNTVFYALALILGYNIFGLIIAVLIYKKSKINNFFRTIYFLPAIFSSVSVGLVWSFIYDPNIGALNTILKYIGLENLTTPWLSNPKIAIFAVVLIHMWATIGYSMVVYIAGLQDIPEELYEAAEVDGVNIWKKFFYITLPLLRNSIMINIVLATINGFTSFDFIYIMTRGGVNHSSEVLATLLYREGFNYGNIGYSSAIAVFLVIIVLLISVFQTQSIQENIK
jgi:raffinose/stachyose/melibiose transport system permease protein